jgi:hypothetical protein
MTGRRWVVVAGLALVGGSGGLGGCGGLGGSGPCEQTCAQYGIDCGMYIPPGCDVVTDCGSCPGGQICGGAGTPNHCAAAGTWRPDSTIQSVFFGSDVYTVWGRCFRTSNPRR